MSSETSDNLAILIDGDNVSAKVIDGIMTEVAKYGTASVRRIYGDFTSPSLKPWKECLLQHSIIPMQQYAYTSGKNSTDGAMIIDAMDLLYTGRFKAFCIVSSDSDFTRLAARIREQGVTVYGFGERKTHYAFIAACSRFIYFDVLNMTIGDEAGPEARRPRSQPSFHDINPKRAAEDFMSDNTLPPQKVVRIDPPTREIDNVALDALEEAIMNCQGPEHEHANLANVGHYLSRISPDLNARNYGFRNLREFVEASGIAEVRMDRQVGKMPVAFARLKNILPARQRPDNTPSSLRMDH